MTTKQDAQLDRLIASGGTCSYVNLKGPAGFNSALLRGLVKRGLVAYTIVRTELPTRATRGRRFENCKIVETYTVA